MSEKRFREKLSGRVRFPEDVTSKQIIHGGALRSPYPSGIIEEIKIPKLPPDCYVIGYENIPGTKKMQLPQGEMPIMANRHVSYLGEPLLLVGAPTRKQLRSLINSIEIRITPEPELSPISLDSRENIIYERHFNRGEAEDTLERDDLVLDEDFYSIAAQIPTTRSSPHVSCQREGNRYIIHSVNQWPSMVKKNTASVLKIRRDQIILRNYTTDNCQDSRLWSTILNSCYAALLCQASKRPVRFLLEDDWNALLTPRRGKVEFYVRGAQTTEGDLLALKIDFVQDVGAYGLLTPELIDRMVMAASGVYHCRHLEISGRGIRTNNPPSGVLPDFNLAPLFFAIESFVHNMARNCGISPYEWKEKNLIRRGNLFLGASTVPPNTNLSPLINKLMENSDYQRKEMSYQMLYEQKESISSNNESFQRGISYSLAYLGNDFLYNHTDLTTMTVRGVLNKEGELTLYLPVQPGMDRIKRVWAKIATDILQLENKSLVSFSFDQERMNGGPSTAGRNIIHVTRLIELCCEQISEEKIPGSSPSGCNPPIQPSGVKVEQQ
jgi:CO/xanthine dehydrogenase Mo-binding subunit